MWRDFFYFTRTERRGILLLAMLVATACVLPRFLPSAPADGEETAVPDSTRQEYARFLASLREEKKPLPLRRKYTNRPEQNDAPQEIHLTAFDPNTADSATFVRLGLPSWMARNILRYRDRKGVFRRPEDFRKIYGMTDEQFRTLHPYIRIAPIEEMCDTARLSLLIDSLPVRRDTIFKYAPGTVVELNSADTTELKKIPGIGSAIARMIVDYRRRLGAYYRVEQLGDIRLKADRLRTWFSVDTTLIRPIPVNKTSVERLMRHPYLNFYQAKVINEHRKKWGDIRSLKELSLYEEFTPADLARIAPYLSFD